MGKTWFGHYRLDRLLGSGGTGQVWLARDTVADRTVALKVLACSHAADPTCRLRFTREARLAAQAPGPHRVPIHDFGELDGRLYIDMEFIEGTDVSALLRESGPLDPARAVAIIAQTAMALDAMHRVGLVHRDVKPSNIMVGPTGFVHLIDFGIAHRIDQPAITAHGNVVGTLAYMAPERFDGIADARADQYSLGCVLYECLTGQRPFGNVDSPQQLRAHLLTVPPSAATLNPAVPASLDTVITRAMAKDPNQRYSSAGEFAATAYTAVTGREASTVEIAAATEPTNYGALEPSRPAESLGVGAAGFATDSAGGPTRPSPAERMQVADSAGAPMCTFGVEGEQMRANEAERMQVAGSAAAPMWALESAGEQRRNVGSARATMWGGPSTGAEMQGSRPAPEPMGASGAEVAGTEGVAAAWEPMWVSGSGGERVWVAEHQGERGRDLGDAGEAMPGGSEGTHTWAARLAPEQTLAGGVQCAGIGDAGAARVSARVGGAVSAGEQGAGFVPEVTWVAGGVGGGMRGGEAADGGMRDGGAVRASMRGGRKGGQSMQGGAAERTREVGTSSAATWVGGGLGEPGRDDELWGARGVGAGYAAVAIAALVGVIGLGLWLGRPGGETNSAAPSSARSRPTLPGSLAPTESAQQASPNVVIPRAGQLCNPNVDGIATAVDGTPLACRTVGAGIANWVPTERFGGIPDGQQSEPTVVGNGNPHVNNSASGDSGNDKPNKDKPGHGGGRAKPGK
ncbi:serine/threonine-protein kinase [Nocardia sp. CA-084685]|uniref:serine/threonine-protein kinase n=1 Tax=Nocardia sp. CA-084685 TaxID=3239970 RepID=UPI003D96AD87